MVHTHNDWESCQLQMPHMQEGPASLGKLYHYQEEAGREAAGEKQTHTFITLNKMGHKSKVKVIVVCVSSSYQCL